MWYYDLSTTANFYGIKDETCALFFSIK